MRLGRSRQSSNIEDRRRNGPRAGRAGIGLGTIVLALVALYFGVDPAVVLQMADQGTSSPAPATQTTGAPTDAQGQFVSRVLGETEDTWRTIFNEQTNGRYRDATLVLYRGATPTACGTGQSAMGPFYCPADTRVYIDLAFFDQMASQMNAPGQFAQAYVIAHEIGHHVQHQLGTLERVNRQRAAASTSQANRLSVRLELQADCYAGVWSCRPTAMRASGPIMPMPPARSSRPVTSRRHWTPPAPSVTTHCNVATRDRSCLIRLHTVPPSSACNGSVAA